jgi:glycosyl transferase, family 25
MLNIQILVISLKRAQSRREKVILELGKTTLGWQFLDAVDGAQLNMPIPDYSDIKVRRLLGFPLTPSELGCFLSHRTAWERCVSTNQITLVLEDDFVLSPDFEKELGLLLDHSDHWNLVRLQGLVEVDFTSIRLLGGHQLVHNHHDPLASTAYILNPDAAASLIQHAQTIFEPLDHYLEHKKVHGVQMLAMKPYPVWINGLTSTISDRPDRQIIRGYRKRIRSFWRYLDRLTNTRPWFPK